MGPEAMLSERAAREKIQTIFDRKFRELSKRSAAYKILADNLQNLQPEEEEAVYELLNDHLQIWRVER